MEPFPIHSEMKVHRPGIIKFIKKDIYYYALLVLPLLYLIIFKYGPMFGNLIAFRKYRLGLSMFGSQWVGFKYFRLFIDDPAFWLAFKNSLLLSFFNLIIAFPIPIIFALLLNEITNSFLKRFIQTVSYLPRFLSTIVIVGMIKEGLSPSTGIVNGLLTKWFGIQPIFFINEPNWFRAIYISSDIWQYMGWSAIIYLAALAGVQPELYEAATMDGANRFKQTLHITIPGIMSTIVITLILSVGSMLSLGFEKVLLIYTPNNSETSDILDTLVYRMGLQNNNYSYATAIGLFSGIIALLLISGANYIARKATDTSLF